MVDKRAGLRLLPSRSDEPSEEDDGIGWCPCGAAWFRLEPFDEPEADPEIGAAVCVSPEGGITGYAGKLVCMECGQDWHPHHRARLTVVHEDRS